MSYGYGIQATGYRLRQQATAAGGRWIRWQNHRAASDLELDEMDRIPSALEADSLLLVQRHISLLIEDAAVHMRTYEKRMA